MINLKTLKKVLTPVYYKKLCKWLAGQTVALIEKEEWIYDNDLLRWLDDKPIID